MLQLTYEYFLRTSESHGFTVQFAKDTVTVVISLPFTRSHKPHTPVNSFTINQPMLNQEPIRAI